MSIVIENIYKHSDELNLFSDQITAVKNWSTLSDDRLVNIIQEYVDKIRRLRVWGFVPVFIDGLFKSFLTDYLQRQFKIYLTTMNQGEMFGKYYSVMSMATKTSAVQEEEISRLDLLIKIKEKDNWPVIFDCLSAKKIEVVKSKFPLVYDLLLKHLNDFSWLLYDYTGPAMTMDELLDRLINDISRSDVVHDRTDINIRYQNIKQEKEKIIQEINLPEDLIYLFEVSAELMFIKDYRKSIYQRSYVAMNNVFMEICRRIGLSLTQTQFMAVDEIIDALLNKKGEIYRYLTGQRQEKCCYVAENGIIKVFEGAAAEEVIKNLVGESLAVNSQPREQIMEIKGMTAYGGKVQGTVRIVIHQADIDKVKEGDILIASATSPVFILAMKKAAAFVTDTGGIISHAAIVSREMQKPCVVGTKVATHVFKDGDLVEVDADNGMVKKI